MEADKSLLNPGQVIDFFESHSPRHKRLDAVIGTLKRKKVRKIDPLLVANEVAYYLFSTDDKQALNELYTELIKPRIDAYMQEEAQTWGVIEGLILVYSYMNGSNDDLAYINRRGFVKTRLEGAMYDLHLRNAQKELGVFEQTKMLPKDTLLWRNQCQITELVLMLTFNKFGFFQKSKKVSYQNKLKKAKERFAFITDNYYESDLTLYEHLGENQ